MHVTMHRCIAVVWSCRRNSGIQVHDMRCHIGSREQTYQALQYVVTLFPFNIGHEGMIGRMSHKHAIKLPMLFEYYCT